MCLMWFITTNPHTHINVKRLKITNKLNIELLIYLSEALNNKQQLR